MELPACVASTVQVPPVSIVREVPEMVQTAPVSEAKLTGNPDDAVALIASGVLCHGFAATAPKVMVWFAGATVTETVVLVDIEFAVSPLKVAVSE